MALCFYCTDKQTFEVRRQQSAFFFLPVPDDLDVFSVLALAVPPLSVHDGGVHVGGGERVGFIQQRDHTEQNGPEREADSGTSD